MIKLSRTALLFVTGALVATTVACSSAAPAPDDGTTEQPIKAGSSPMDPTTPTTSGDPTGTSATADAGPDASPDAGATCCDPAAKPDGPFREGISCCLDNVWHPSLGAGPASTCAAHGGVGVVCGAAPVEVCGGPPTTAFCAACPGGSNGYKQIDGQPTCDCCAVD